MRKSAVFPNRGVRADGDRQTVTVRAAEPHEAGEIVRVINAAFNPAESFFVDGDRTDLAQVRDYFVKGMFLVALVMACGMDGGTDGDMAGCVYVELRGERGYFGLLGVDPSRQKTGVGRALITAAENYARAHGCHYMDMGIVNLRVELPALYRKLGYQEAGTKPFTPGVPTKLPCYFIKMQKALV